MSIHLADGSDNLEQFPRWRRVASIGRSYPIALIRRPGTVLASLHAGLARRLGVSPRLAGRLPWFTGWAA